MNFLPLNTSWSPVSSLGETALQEPPLFAPPPSHPLPQRSALFRVLSRHQCCLLLYSTERKSYRKYSLVSNVFLLILCLRFIYVIASYRTTLSNVVANHILLFTCKLFKIKSNKKFGSSVAAPFQVLIATWDQQIREQRTFSSLHKVLLDRAFQPVNIT